MYLYIYIYIYLSIYLSRYSPQIKIFACGAVYKKKNLPRFIFLRNMIVGGFGRIVGRIVPFVGGFQNFLNDPPPPPPPPKNSI